MRTIKLREGTYRWELTECSECFETRYTSWTDAERVRSEIQALYPEDVVVIDRPEEPAYVRLSIALGMVR